MTTAGKPMSEQESGLRCIPCVCVVITSNRMCKEWRRVYPDSWRSIWRKSVWVSSLIISLSGVQLLKASWIKLSLKYVLALSTFGSVQFPALKLCSGCFPVTSSREQEWESEDRQVFSFVSAAGQREEKSRKSEGDLLGKHGSFAKTDSAVPLGR